jgi:hypothetical protein
MRAYLQLAMATNLYMLISCLYVIAADWPAHMKTARSWQQRWDRRRHRHHPLRTVGVQNYYSEFKVYCTMPRGVAGFPTARKLPVDRWQLQLQLRLHLQLRLKLRLQMKPVLLEPPHAIIETPPISVLLESTIGHRRPSLSRSMRCVLGMRCAIL